MSQAAADISANISADLDCLPAQVHQAFNTLHLEPEQELARYRLYKNGGLESLTPVSAQVLSGEPSRPLIDITDEEEDEEEYELIPPSQPFAVREPEPQPAPSGAMIPGELVLSSHLRDDESLDLSFVSPGEITQSHNEYLPASKELWRSLGQPEPAAPASVPQPRWRLPVAIGSTVLAVASVAGMTYVNTHPALLKNVPMVAQLTAAPAPVQIPPGQSLQGPDLSMGEFTELTLANLNGITLPGTMEPIAAAPAPAPVAVTTTPTAPVPVAAPPSTALAPSPAPTVATATTTAPSGNSTLADSLIRNLLPANIQQVNASPATPKTETKTTATTKPYTPPNAMSFQAQSGTNGYRVITEYQGPSALGRIQSLVPKATLDGSRINLGSFKNKSEAETLIKRLAQKGFVARIQ